MNLLVKLLFILNIKYDYILLVNILKFEKYKLNNFLSFLK